MQGTKKRIIRYLCDHTFQYKPDNNELCVILFAQIFQALTTNLEHWGGFLGIWKETISPISQLSGIFCYRCMIGAISAYFVNTPKSWVQIPVWLSLFALFRIEQILLL